MLSEAVAPLLESLSGCADVAAPLSRRFTMQKWFQAQGLAPSPHFMQRNASLPPLKVTAPSRAQLRGASVAPGGASVAAGASPTPLADACAAEVMRQNPYKGALLVCDFDKTLVDFDTGGLLVWVGGRLGWVPDLTGWLAGRVAAAAAACDPLSGLTALWEIWHGQSVLPGCHCQERKEKAADRRVQVYVPSRVCSLPLLPLPNRCPALQARDCVTSLHPS
jgi:hypothetical protein